MVAFWSRCWVKPSILLLSSCLWNIITEPLLNHKTITMAVGGAIIPISARQPQTLWHSYIPSRSLGLSQMLRGTNNASQLATIKITGANWRYSFIWGLVILVVLVNWFDCESTFTDSHVYISLSKLSNSSAKVVRNLVGNSEGWEWDSIMQKHVFVSSSCPSHSSTNQTGSQSQPIKASPLTEEQDD